MTYIGKLAKGSLISSDGSKELELPVGTNGEILLADSTEMTGLKWAPSGGGGGDFELITSATANNVATVELTGLTTPYSIFRVVVENFTVATDAAFLWLRTSSDNGSTYDSGASDYTKGLGQALNSAGIADVIGADSKMTFANFGIGNAANESANYTIDFWTDATVGFSTFIIESMYITPVGNVGRCVGYGSRGSASVVDALQFSCSSGNILTGNFRIYGLKS